MPDLFAWAFQSRPRVVYLAQYFPQLLLQRDLCGRTSLASEPRDKVLHFDFVLYGRLLDNNSHRCESLADLSYPIVLLQGRKSGSDRFIECLRSDFYGVLNVPDIFYRNCARSENHVRKRSIFAFSSLSSWGGMLTVPLCFLDDPQRAASESHYNVKAS